MPEIDAAAQKPTPEKNDASTPEDVATLYSWANLHGAKYRDFSASRAQVREETRLRAEAAAAEEKRRQEEEAERKRQEEAQIAARLAAEAAEAARQAEAERLAEIARQAEAERQAVLAAQEAQRQAAQQRPWQPPMPEVFQGGYGASTRPAHGVTSGFQEDEPADFTASSLPAAGGSVTPAELGSMSAQREFAAPVWRSTHGSSASERPFAQPFHSAPASNAAAAPAPETQFPQGAGNMAAEGYPVQRQDAYLAAPWHAPEFREGREMRETVVRPAWLAPELPAERSERAERNPQQYGMQVPAAGHFPAGVQSAPVAVQTQVPMYAQFSGQGAGQGSGPGHAPGQTPGQAPAQNSGIVDETLLGSRDKIANRWYALKSVLDPHAAPEQVAAQPPARVPVLAIFSLAGGVGKTSLVASLGRALSSRGERVLLVDTAAYGLLPFFFGARDQRPGMLRTFNPPGASADAPIQLVTLDPDGQPPEHGGSDLHQGQIPDPNSFQGQGGNPDWLAQEIGRYTRAAHRVLIDLPTASGSTTRRVLRLAPTVVVPVLPDMNSVVSVGAIESFFRNNGTGVNTGGKQILPYYLLNQFDYSLPLHLDVREILREQIGDRLLPFALRRSPAVSEALAEGMTVMDYAPSAVVAEDYANLAGWVRSLSAPATQSYRGVRWSER